MSIERLNERMSNVSSQTERLEIVAEEIQIFADNIELENNLDYYRKEIQKKSCVNFISSFLAWFEQNYFLDYSDCKTGIKITYEKGNKQILFSNSKKLEFVWVRESSNHSPLEILAEVSLLKCGSERSELYFTTLRLLLEFFNIEIIK